MFRITFAALTVLLLTSHATTLHAQGLASPDTISAKQSFWSGYRYQYGQRTLRSAAELMTVLERSPSPEPARLLRISERQFVWSNVLSYSGAAVAGAGLGAKNNAVAIPGFVAAVAGLVLQLTADHAKHLAIRAFNQSPPPASMSSLRCPNESNAPGASPMALCWRFARPR